jgi:hypothetical protein
MRRKPQKENWATLITSLGLGPKSKRSIRAQITNGLSAVEDPAKLVRTGITLLEQGKKKVGLERAHFSGQP